MNPGTPPDWAHDHVFHAGNPAAERGTRAVMWITAAMMVVEILAGWWFNSMALLADGWHMSSHAVAIGLSAFAYATARRYARDPRFAFGTWKIEVLAGFASAIFLLCIAGLMVLGSLERLVAPRPIHYEQALAVAALGLAVNVVCALILGRAHDDPHHSHDHGHAHGPDGHEHEHGHHPDLNLKSAYLHVIADAATSVLAITALAGGWFYGWARLDPLMGIVGAALVGSWAVGLLKETGRALLDAEMDGPVVDEIRTALAGLPVPARVLDLHVWRVGKGRYACIVSLASPGPLAPADVRSCLAVHPEIVHVTAEVNPSD
jgi:cation diffusion facilitator family transporter